MLYVCKYKCKHHWMRSGLIYYQCETRQMYRKHFSKCNFECFTLIQKVRLHKEITSIQNKVNWNFCLLLATWWMANESSGNKGNGWQKPGISVSPRCVVPPCTAQPAFPSFSCCVSVTGHRWSGQLLQMCLKSPVTAAPVLNVTTTTSIMGKTCMEKHSNLQSHLYSKLSKHFKYFRLQKKKVTPTN